MRVVYLRKLKFFIRRGRYFLLLFVYSTLSSSISLSAPVKSSLNHFIEIEKVLSLPAVDINTFIELTTSPEKALHEISQAIAQNTLTDLSSSTSLLKDFPSIEIRVFQDNIPLATTFYPITSKTKSTSSDISETPFIDSAYLLRIALNSVGEFSATPKKLKDAQPNNPIKVDFDGSAEKYISSFVVRDETLVKWDRSRKELLPIKDGSTEIYFIGDGQLVIIPIEILPTEQKSLLVNENFKDLAPVSEDLINIDSLLTQSFDRSKINATSNELSDIPEVPESLVEIPFEQLSASDSFGASTAEDTENTEDTEDTKDVEENDEESQAISQSDENNIQQSTSILNEKTLSYETVQIQVVDDRSQLDDKKIYPVNDVDVHIIGTNYKVRTDIKGRTALRDLPKEASVLVSIDDPSGRVRPSVLKISSAEKNISSNLIYIKTIRSFAFDGFAEMIGIVQEADQASLCGNVHEAFDENKKSIPSESIVVRSDSPGDGPYFFNRYGFMDRSIDKTSENGRFCMFNLMPGPTNLHIYAKDDRGQEAFLATYTVSLFAGKHTEENFDLSQTLPENGFLGKLVSSPTAHEQLGSGELANSYRPIDYIDMIPLGESDPLNSIRDSIISNNQNLLLQNGSLRLFSDAAEFEPAVYQFDINTIKWARSHKKPLTIPLLPRGFIEDTALFAQVSPDLMLGSVVVNFGDLDGFDKSQNINIRLFDENGQSVGEAWHYSDKPLSKAIFFNVQPGTYMVSVESSDHTWLAADTVTVFSQTVSFIMAGSPIY